MLHCQPLLAFSVNAFRLHGNRRRRGSLLQSLRPGSGTHLRRRSCFEIRRPGQIHRRRCGGVMAWGAWDCCS